MRTTRPRKTWCGRERSRASAGWPSLIAPERDSSLVAPYDALVVDRQKERAW
jgi:hypothetical protein